jgi:hypothetical protein
MCPEVDQFKIRGLKINIIIISKESADKYVGLRLVGEQIEAGKSTYTKPYSCTCMSHRVESRRKKKGEELSSSSGEKIEEGAISGILNDIINYLILSRSSSRASGLVVKFNVAIVEPRVRFSAGAFFAS